MGHFTAIGMRTKVNDVTSLVINTCSDNDSREIGDIHRWSWSNPTNRKFLAGYADLNAVSVESLWQGTKIMNPTGHVDFSVIRGEWKKNKGKKPYGAYAGFGRPLITNQGEARRKIYIPAFTRQITSWIRESEEVRYMLKTAVNWDGNVYLRDFDTGRGIDRNGPMSHAWLLAIILNEIVIGKQATDDIIKNKLPDTVEKIIERITKL